MKHPNYRDIGQNEDPNFKDNLTPQFKYDTRGRLVMPLPGYSQWHLSTEPGSKIISQGSSDESDKPATDPGSIRTGALHSDTIITIGESIRLDAINKFISVGDKPGELGGAFIMADNSLTGWQDTSIRFGWFLNAETWDSKAFDKGDFYVGNIVIDKVGGTITSGKGLWWDNANSKLYVGGDVVIGGSVTWGNVIDDGNKPDDDATLGATFGVDIAGGSTGTNYVNNNGYITTITGSSVTTGTLNASLCNVTNINAGNISVGTLNVSRIANYSLEETKLGTTVISGGKIVTGLLTADNIITGTLTGVTIQSSSGNDKIVLNTGDYLDFYTGGVLKARLRATTGGAGGLKLIDGDLAVANPHSFIMEETTSNQFATLGCNASSQLVMGLPSTNQFFIKDYAGTSNLFTVSSTQVYCGKPLKLLNYFGSYPGGSGSGTLGWMYYNTQYHEVWVWRYNGATYEWKALDWAP